MTPHPLAIWQRLRRGCCLTALIVLPLQAFRGTIEADSEVDLYLNGVYTRPDTTSPTLPLNGERRYDTLTEKTVIVFAQTDPFSPGDVIGLHVRNTKDRRVPVRSATGKVKMYDGAGAIIAAFEDGILTNDKWRCQIAWQEKWQFKRFSDLHWPFAVVQNTDCCPWRDKTVKWKRLNAKWIGPGNTTSRQFFCRHTVVAGQTIMDGSVISASASAPEINVTSMELGISAAVVKFSVAQPCDVYCMLIDTRFQLRIPSVLEIEKVGKKVPISGWDDVTIGYYRNGYNLPALEWSLVGNEIRCQAKCMKYTGAGGPCTAITFYRLGRHYPTGKNCKLMRRLDNAFIVLAPLLTNGARVMHMAMQQFPIQNKAGIFGLLFPGVVYGVYCSTRDTFTKKHSTWAAVAKTELIGRTKGCFDCGLKTLPYIKIFGGWASHDGITMIVWSSQSGRVFCGAKPMKSAKLKSGVEAAVYTQTVAEVRRESIQKSRHFALISKPAMSTMVTVTGLKYSTLHEIACMAQGESGGASDLANMQDTRRRWWTEAVVCPIWSMIYSMNNIVPPTATLSFRVRMTVIGYIWCKKYLASETKEGIIPRKADLKASGFRIKLADIKQAQGGVFPGLPHNITTQVFCTGQWDDFRNESAYGLDLPPAYPGAEVKNFEMGEEGEMTLTMLIVRGPARTMCRAFRWPNRPFTYRPPAPDVKTMLLSQYKIDTPFERDGIVTLTLHGLVSGTLHDIYCFAEELLPPAPPNSLQPPKEGMTPLAILKTRITVKTSGPKYRDPGWNCVAGHPCKLSHIEGVGLTSRDKVVIQGEQCPGRCNCNGWEDADRKGSTCSPVSHDRNIRAPDPQYNGYDAVDKVDPRGPWCYVTEGVCYDARPSPTFGTLYISYQACIFQNSSVGVPGSGPRGFPDYGLARLASSEGDAFSIGSGPLIAGGKPYHLCWCNGTSALCRVFGDFRLRMGILHLSGPDTVQQTRVMSCVAGMPCILTYFRGHGLANGNRLVVMPNTKLGCNWFRETIGDAVSTPGVPNSAVSLPATDGGTTFSWGAELLRASGAVYLLCWCGSTSGAHHTLSPACPLPRPEKGDHYFAPAGYLSVVGPASTGVLLCSTGIECKLRNIAGNDLTGGDKVIVLQECGKALPAPKDWAWPGPPDAEAAMLSNSLPGGWLRYGSTVSSFVLESSGGPVRASRPRGVWGMPNYGMSQSEPRPGFFSWGGPSQIAPGIYSLCWCAARVECTKPEHFQMLISPILFRGPTVLPSASQARICVRNRQCEILNFTGEWPSSGGQMFIASGLCGSSKFALGAPRDGISFTSGGGGSFLWGSEALKTPPGKYRLCWCFKGFVCTQAEEFASFAGLLRVKAPFGPLRHFFCGIGKPCKIEGIVGEGSSSRDLVMVMTVCGSGEGADAFELRGLSQETGPDGTSFVLPRAVKGGEFRACWCAGESLCVEGVNFDHDLGALIVGGPDPSALYLCYEWEPCALKGLKGKDLFDGDRLLVVSPDVNGTASPCSTFGPGPWVSGESMNNVTNITPAVTPLGGWPQDGLSSFGTSGGTVFSWGSAQNRMVPSIYTLCWCSAVLAPGGICNGSAPFDMQAGQIRVGTSKEFQFATRVDDPDTRSMESMYGLLLLAPLLLVACTLGLFGWKKVHRLNNNIVPQAPPPFPKTVAWSAAEQQTLRLSHNIKQVAAQRELALGTLMVAELESQEPDLLEMDAPNFVGARKMSLGTLARAQMTKALAVVKRLQKEDDKMFGTGEDKKGTGSAKIVPITDEDKAPAGKKSSSRSSKKKPLEVRSIRDKDPTPAGPKGRGAPKAKAAYEAPEKEEKDFKQLGPAIPTALWAEEWDSEDDGTMPPSMEFAFNQSEKRNTMMTKILDM